MALFSREGIYTELLSVRERSVSELAEKLFISEPTVRRDVQILKEKNMVKCKRGIVSLKSSFADRRIPLSIRDYECIEQKRSIAIKAVKEVKDGDTVMLDASTTVACLVPHLAQLKNILAITNGARTALELTSFGIKTLCTGGEMTQESYSYIGPDAEKMLSMYNADVAFFSCRGLSVEGVATDTSIMENSMRRIMMKNSKRKFLLCDSSKYDKKYISTLCSENEIDGIICDIEVKKSK